MSLFRSAFRKICSVDVKTLSSNWGVCNQMQQRFMSRVKMRFTVPPFWQPKKTRTLYPEDTTKANEEFLSQMIAQQYKESPLRTEPFEYGKWEPRSVRCGLIAKKLGIYPMWRKDGKRILTTLLQASDNHVIKYIPPEKMEQHDIRYKRRVKSKRLGALVVGADSADPRIFTKQYCTIFEETGVMPKKKLTKFLITPNAALPPGTPLFASHFSPGDYVDIHGVTIDRGFQGVMKRWGFKGGPATHGTTKSHRRGGYIGGGPARNRVWPGKKMPGHMGRYHRMHRGVMVWRIDTEENILWVSGPAVPGHTGSYVILYDSLLPLRWKTEKNPPHFPTFFQEEVEIAPQLFHKDLHIFSDPSITFEESEQQQ